jgi:D-glycero-alpha-D-manno-heptose-7-phosphate kinase
MRDQAERLFHDLTSLQVHKLGQALKEGWELKKSLAKGISDTEIDEIHEKALKAGALGGQSIGSEPPLARTKSARSRNNR